jgi:hypothetical protein
MSGGLVLLASLGCVFGLCLSLLLPFIAISAALVNHLGSYYLVPIILVTSLGLIPITFSKIVSSVTASRIPSFELLIGLTVMILLFEGDSFPVLINKMLTNNQTSLSEVIYFLGESLYLAGALAAVFILTIAVTFLFIEMIVPSSSANVVPMLFALSPIIFIALFGICLQFVSQHLGELPLLLGGHSETH